MQVSCSGASGARSVHGRLQPQEKIDVRILASTNKSLPGLVEKGLFREDLYFRLNVVSIEVPPLRDRGEDIALLIHHFSRRFSGQLGRSLPRFRTRYSTSCKTAIRGRATCANWRTSFTG